MTRLTREDAEQLVQHLIHPSKWGDLPEEVREAARPPYTAYEGQIKVGVALVDGFYFVLRWDHFGRTGPVTESVLLSAKDETLCEIGKEVIRARAKFPGNRHLTTALGEEFGELCRAMLQKKPLDEVRKEAIQVACLAIRIIEEGDATFADLTEAESLR